MSSTVESSPSPFDDLPRTIVTSSILPYTTSADWLNFRLASRSSYEIVHGTTNVAVGVVHASSNTTQASSSSIQEHEEDSESLWQLALIRDYQFDTSDDGTYMHQCFRCPNNTNTSSTTESDSDSGDESFLSTSQMFTAANLYESWKHWRKLDARLHYRRPRGNNIPRREQLVGPYFLRAGAMWKKIEQWLDDESRSQTLGREIRDSLSPGRALDPNAGRLYGKATTSAIKAVYAFYSGQQDGMMQHHPALSRIGGSNPFGGMFGGFQAYHMISSTRWMEPEMGRSPANAQHVLHIAQGEDKIIIMDLSTGQMHSFFVGPGGQGYLTATPCPSGVNRLTNGRRTIETLINPLEGQDSILRWFEEHANRLDQDLFSLVDNPIGIPGADSVYGLMRYPSVNDTSHCSRAVTRGVEVLASAIHCPSMDSFVYSIRIRMLTPDDEGYLTPEQRGFITCQLRSRYWRVSSYPPDSGEPMVDEVRGDGVIGNYPLLHQGGYTHFEGNDPGDTEAKFQGTGHFMYQSCSQADMPGSFEGYLQFVPGSLAEATGAEFDVRVAPFPLEFSEYLY